ncbi:MAG: hypothetical protein L3J94_10785 [Gammaproteobacteria bacterium]|nr:hypothetical protein [Gammaproteobacteria bacterium]
MDCRTDDSVKILSTSNRREAYQRMKEYERRLPWSLAETTLKALEKETK